MMINASTYESVNTAEHLTHIAAQGVVVRQNAHLRCSDDATVELYLYTNGKFKLLLGSTGLSGTYTIEDGENLVLDTGYSRTYAKIYFRGVSVSRVEIVEAGRKYLLYPVR